MSKEDCYLKTTEIYSSLDDTTVKNSSEKVWNMTSEDAEDTVYIREYQPWEETFWEGIKRDYKEYNVSHINLDTAYDYYSYGVENFDVDYTTGTDKPKDEEMTMNDLVLYQDDYIEVEKTTYEYIGKDLDRDNYHAGLMVMYLLYLMLWGIFFIVEDHLDWTFREIVDDFQIDKKFYQNNYQRLQEVINKLMKLINSNEEYRNKFNELYEENKFLLDNPEELYRRINDLSMQQKVADSKKLIREFKEKKNY